ncbi:MAG: ATP-binding protein [Candidatus Acidiferrales bacterium]
MAGRAPQTVGASRTCRVAESIFDAFYRLSQSAKAPEGTDLGLAIAQRLVELHGGRPGVDGTPGAGSCFYLTLSMVPTIDDTLHRIHPR